MAEKKREPFIFGVSSILGEPRLVTLLHQQFPSDERLSNHLRGMGYDVNLVDPSVTIDTKREVVVERVVFHKNGKVGSLDLIDVSDKHKLGDLIDEAADLQTRRELGDPLVRGLFD